eukprot:395208-Prymnesium_polylepis.1
MGLKAPDSSTNQFDLTDRPWREPYSSFMSKQPMTNDSYIDKSLAIYDTGSPTTIVGQQWLNTYVKKLRHFNPEIDHAIHYDTNDNSKYGFGANEMQTPIAHV